MIPPYNVKSPLMFFSYINIIELNQCVCVNRLFHRYLMRGYADTAPQICSSNSSVVSVYSFKNIKLISLPKQEYNFVQDWNQGEESDK